MIPKTLIKETFWKVDTKLIQRQWWFYILRELEVLEYVSNGVSEPKKRHRV